MEVRFESSPRETAAMDTAELRANYLVNNLMQAGKLQLTYTHFDRMIIGGAMPVQQSLTLSGEEELKALYFLERREIGIINVGGKGKIDAGDSSYLLNKLDCLYIGRGTTPVIFSSIDPATPASFYFISTPAHAGYETNLCTKEDATPVKLGSQETGNVRTIYKYIHQAGVQSCQLVMGLTILETGSVWNSVPPHTHTRRTEVYYYFDLGERERVFHFMGEPHQTRHIIVRNSEAVISPPWSVHFGSGTMNYGFIWAMAGENQAFDDMDASPVASLL